jgi:hypothetical protein
MGIIWQDNPVKLLSALKIATLDTLLSAVHLTHVLNVNVNIGVDPMGMTLMAIIIVEKIQSFALLIMPNARGCNS